MYHLRNRNIENNKEPIRADIERNQVLEDQDHQFGHLDRIEAERVAAEEEERKAEILEDPPIEDIEDEPVEGRPEHIVARDPDMVEFVRRLVDKPNTDISPSVISGDNAEDLTDWLTSYN